MIRLYVPDVLHAGAHVALSAGQAHYLTGVMRQGVGDALALFNGRDGEWRAEVAEVSRRGCTLIVRVQMRKQSAGPDLDLIVALVKRARLEAIVEKATELGVRRIRLALTQFTNADRANLVRLQTIAIAAAEQTGRLDVPQVTAPEALARLLDGWDAGRRLVFCDEAGEAAPMLEAMSERPGAERVRFAILIGPEGGFAPGERERLRSLAFVTPVTLGPRILRADTAAISALTLWQAALGDWG